MRLRMEWVIAFVLGFLISYIAHSAVAHAQFAPMPLYQHPMAGHPDPYAMWPSCCSGHDCVPWDGADIEETESGFYIRSLGAEVPLGNKVKNSFNGQYHVCKPIVNGDIRNRWIDATGKSSVYCLFVPSGM